MKYRGDLAVEQAFDLLRDDPSAILVDCRSRAEWTFVGVPDLSGLGRQVIFAEWQTFPGMVANPQFFDEVVAAGATPDRKMLFLCRSGARSAAAAEMMTTKGFDHCFNIAGGFEGGLDSAQHRGILTGWKAVGLPWIQG